MVLNTNGMPFTLLFLNLFSLDKTTFPIFLSIRFSGYPRDINQGFVLTLHYLKSFSLEHSRPTYLQCWTVNNGSVWYVLDKMKNNADIDGAIFGFYEEIS